MIYFRTTDGRCCMVVELENLNRLVDGRPMKSPDEMVLVCYTPDMAWTAEQVRALGDPQMITGAQLAEIIDASSKRAKAKEDELGQVMLVSHTDDKIRVDFGKDLRWFQMSKDQAIQFGLLIFQHCGVPVQVNLAPAPEAQGGAPV